VRGAVATDAAASRARELIRSAFDAQSIALVDSGTSALVLALRTAVRRGGTVAFPGFACVDLAAAASFAGVRVRLYDVDPQTLSPDLDSVSRVLQRGVDAVLVAHLFGYAADVPSVRELAQAAGVPTIEDAAQGAGGLLGGRRLGSIGDLVVVSFGRGKGLCAGGGGALLAFADPWTSAVDALAVPSSGRGMAGLAKTAVQWALGRPSVYAIPSALPWLRLGEMVYHPASEPTSLSAGSSALLPSALSLDPAEVDVRRANAAKLDALIRVAPGVERVAPIGESKPGYLRYALRDGSGRRAIAPRLGIVKPYPRTLLEQPELRESLVANEPPTPGATELRASLFTLPTHSRVNASDLRGMERWLMAGSSCR
jgi:dTDP-4-amino-4,6-dideoxygalactose transaminase